LEISLIHIRAPPSPLAIAALWLRTCPIVTGESLDLTPLHSIAPELCKRFHDGEKTRGEGIRPRDQSLPTY